MAASSIVIMLFAYQAAAMKQLRGMESIPPESSMPSGWFMTDVCKACSNGRWLGLDFSLQDCADANANSSFMVYKPRSGYCGHLTAGCTVFDGGYSCNDCSTSYGSCSSDVAYIFQRGEKAEWSPEMALGAQGLRSVATESCLVEESRVAAPFVEAWRTSCPVGLVQVDDGSEGCVLTRGSSRSMLTLVEHTVENICKDEGPLIGQAQPRSFQVNGRSKEKSLTRNLFVVKPELACNEGKPCPVVVYLHGHDEHAKMLVSSDDPMASDEAWRLASMAGLMRYAHQSDCSKTLKSVLIFPQLLEGESWGANGQDLLADFVLPILRQHRDGKEDGYWNLDEVSIVGYSEGAAGVIHAAKHHRDVFALAVAAATGREHMEDPSLAQHDEGVVTHLPVCPSDQPSLRAVMPSTQKLKLLVTTFGQMDVLSTAKDDLQYTLEDLHESGVSDTVAVHARVYVGAGHIHWDNVFNKWPVLHNVLWGGDYSALQKLG
eukprot:CAMPEP_0170619944 /NCGR_PEP_ID=MMETSP0224-20130122/27790_1 /TAXON_ID=285029 /ORGANISM="Togula jolla, Strain CCCM 725" /LENGTH=488 /DNA_ID=CAMNT_0010946075 /DNA_START=68 /DNA_END=1534 /DNA_ORIENTATION=-